jgi:hypothetical protein
MEWIFLPHPPFRPDLAHDFCLRGGRFADEHKLKHNLREEILRYSQKFYSTGKNRLTQMRKIRVGNKVDFVEK